MAAPQQPRSVTVVMDLGLKSDPNMHRAHSGSLRVRIEARHEWIEPGDFQKADLRTDQRNRLSPKSRRYLRQALWNHKVYISYETEWPAAARNLIPLSRFPKGGKPGRGWFPPRRKHAARQQKTLSRRDAAGSPHKRGCRPLVHPLRAQVLYPLPVRRGEHSKNENKDGRHVVLDFYDLLIEGR
jgi:hypothetical protein